MAGGIPLTKEELKGLYSINPEAFFFFTAIGKTDFLTESQPKSSQTDTASETELELPETLVSLFDPTAINISGEENSKTWYNKKHELYQKAYSIESYKNLLIVTEKQALWMLNKTGNITSPKCYNVCYTDTEKISSPSLLATIM